MIRFNKTYLKLDNWDSIKEYIKHDNNKKNFVNYLYR
jgi:hypothetical protein